MNELAPLVELSKLFFFVGGGASLVTAALAIHRFMTVAVIKLDDLTSSMQALNTNIGTVIESISFIKGRVS